MRAPSRCPGNKGGVESLAGVIAMETRGGGCYHGDRLPLECEGQGGQCWGGWGLGRGVGSVALFLGEGGSPWEHKYLKNFFLKREKRNLDKSPEARSG